MAAALSLQTQYDNLGDEVINSILLREVAKRMPLHALSRNVPDWYLSNLRRHVGEAWSDVTCHRDRSRFAVRLFRQGFQRGRHWLFTACGDVGGATSHYRRDAALAMVAALPAWRLASVGASCARLSASRAALLRRARAGGGLVSMRDTKSARVLLAHGVEAMLVPDLAFKLPFSMQSGATKAVFSFRQMPGLDYGALKRMVAATRRFGLQPVVTWQVGRDETFCRALADIIGIPAIDCLGGRDGRFHRALEFYDGAACVVSNRLHALLIAAARGAAPFAVLPPGEAKIAPLLTDQGMADCILPMSGDGFDVLLEELPARRQPWRQIFACNAARIDACFDRLAAEG